MGVLCQIHLAKPAGGVYKPGSAVNGVVKYTITEDTHYKDITVCLRGEGYCSWSEGTGDSKSTFYGYEEYVNVANSLLENKTEDGVLVEAGVYDRPFRFEIPRNAPPSYNDYDCTIVYFVKLTFEKKGLFKFAKIFRTEIPVANFVTATLPREPMVYGAHKTLISLSGKSHVNMKAIVKKSTLQPGETAELDIEVANESGTKISAIETQLVQEVTYMSDCGNTYSHFVPVKRANHDTEPVKERHTANLNSRIRIPEGHSSIQNSKVLMREYKLRVKAKLPFPYTNLILDIPVEIGDFELKQDDDDMESKPRYNLELLCHDAPPSYWKVMQEDKEVEHKIKKYHMNGDVYQDLEL
ncbi:Arrestin domain-containing protein 2 [Eumeta japonica]|uniref:Arrestin domain-containing protein 2 n=1 Tax=Eumeta variegata TaxID=151549 RepID=A0A4C1X8H6_EUMVA|nr:Arrestin domain-containing protein 2 [Eumeta japonica]